MEVEWKKVLSTLKEKVTAEKMAADPIESVEEEWGTAKGYTFQVRGDWKTYCSQNKIYRVGLQLKVRVLEEDAEALRERVKLIQIPKGSWRIANDEKQYTKTKGDNMEALLI